MFDNVGKKIKSFVKFVFVMECVLVAIFVVISLATVDDAKTNLITLVCAAVFVLASWIGTFVLYGFGELVENSTICRKYIEENLPGSSMANANYSNYEHMQTDCYVGNDKWLCKNCGEKNAQSAIFCRNCGTNK